MGSSTREDEVCIRNLQKIHLMEMLQLWAYEAREFLRAFVVGKEISFVSSHSMPTNDDVPRDIGTAEINGQDLASELLKNGWAKVKDVKREPNEEDHKRRELEAEARANGRGQFNPHGPQVHCFHFLQVFKRLNLQARVVHYTMPTDSQAFVSEWKGRPIDGGSPKSSSCNFTHVCIDSNCRASP